MPASRSAQPNRPAKKAKNWTVFLRELERCGNVTEACRRAHVSRSSAKERRVNHPDFAQAWSDALETAADRLEKEADRRARRGVARLLLYKGSPVVVDSATGEHLPGYLPIRDQDGSETGHGYLTERIYSDTLLIFLLKGIRPDKFADRRKREVSHSGEVGMAVSRSLAEEISAARAARIISGDTLPQPLDTDEEKARDVGH